MTKNVNAKQSTSWIGTYNNIDLVVAKDYLERWTTQHKASYAVG